MKRFIAFLSLLFLLTEGTASAKPDYSELNQAFTNYFASLDAIMKVVPSVTNASGTVQLINAWSLANEELCVVGERFAAKYPEVYDEPEPPPEFVATFEKMDRLKTDYAALNAGLGRLARQFRAVPEVQEAMKRFMKAIDRFDRLSSPPKK